MATPADQRLLELLDLWLRSLELHLEYTSLDDASYAQIRDWPPHQRPGRWILDLAKEKTVGLKAQVEERIKMGDVKFAEALETMTFLANLVGLQHIERFIPLAEAQATTQAPPSGSGATATREMPKFARARPKTARTPSRTAAKTAGNAPAKAPASAPLARTEQVLADAERLLQWGRKWYELAELIARMADRPPLPEVRRILKEHKAALDQNNPRA